MLPQNLEEKIVKTDSCWVWDGAIQGAGYGTAWDKRIRKIKLAHRLVYELLVGPIPDGLTLDHLCRNRACVNPEHLEPVSMKENVLRGISPSAQKARQVLCIRGHELVATPKGRRCFICVANYQASDRAREMARERNKSWRENNREHDVERKRIWREARRARA